MKRRRAKVEEPLVLDKNKDEYLEHLATELEIDPDKLMDAVARQSVLFYRAGRELARLERIEKAAKRGDRVARGRVLSFIHIAARSEGLGSVDPVQSQSQVEAHSDVVNAGIRWQDAQDKTRQAKNLHRSFKHRAWMLNLLVKLKGM